MKIIPCMILALLLSTSLAAKPVPAKSKEVVTSNVDPQTKILLQRYMKNYKKKDELLSLKKDTLALKGKAVPALVQVMKSSKFPEKNRWIATFLLGRIMGNKSGPFILKFAGHPSWVLRMASLKTLLALKRDSKEYGDVYANMLSDKSMIVRHQALENIAKLDLKTYSSNVWAMLYDKENYQQNKKGKKRTSIIKKVVRTIGDLKFEKAKDPLLSMIQKKKYDDIFEDISYSLEKITGKIAPEGKQEVRRVFWKRFALANQTI